MNLAKLLICLSLLAVSTPVGSQDNATDDHTLTGFPTRFLSRIQQTYSSLEAKLVARSEGPEKIGLPGSLAEEKACPERFITGRNAVWKCGGKVCATSAAIGSSPGADAEVQVGYG